MFVSDHEDDRKMRVQIIQECRGTNHYDDHNVYKHVRIFNNRVCGWDCSTHTFREKKVKKIRPRKVHKLPRAIMRRHRPRRCRRHYEKNLRLRKSENETRKRSVSTLVKQMKHVRVAGVRNVILPSHLSTSSKLRDYYAFRMRLVNKVLQSRADDLENKLVTQVGRRISKRKPKCYPKHVFKSSYHALHELDASVHALFDKIKEQNPGWTIRYYSDVDAQKFLKLAFTPDVVQAFQMLKPGAYKSDLLRYCLLYVHGGVWSDLTQSFHVKIDSLLTRHKEIVLVDDIPHMHTPEGHPIPGTYQAFIASIPRHSILLKCIYFIVEACKNKYLGYTALDITGPAMMHPFVKQYGYKYTMKLMNDDTVFDKTSLQPLICIRSPDHRRVLSKHLHYRQFWLNGDIWS